MPCTATRSFGSSITIESAEKDTVPSGRKIGSDVCTGAATSIADGSAGSDATAATMLSPGTGSVSTGRRGASISGCVPSGLAPASMSRTSVLR